MKKNIVHNTRYKNIFRTGMMRAVQLSIVALLVCSFNFSALEETEEYSIKAAFIYKFTNYIEWNSFQNNNNEFVIGVVGSSPIRDELAEIARTKTIKEKRITIVQYNNVDEIGDCRILFIPQKSPVPLGEILSKVYGRGTLTICEKAGSAAQGAGINFVAVENRLKFEANPKAINASGLKASSQLLKLAIIVE